MPRYECHKKVITHGQGLSVALRQHASSSHCSKVHGYALEVTLGFAADALDERGWVVDFGAFKGRRLALEYTFDHALVLSPDDPVLPQFRLLEREGACRIVLLPKASCEGIAEFIMADTLKWMQADLAEAMKTRGLRLTWVEVAEHEANRVRVSAP